MQENAALEALARPLQKAENGPDTAQMSLLFAGREIGTARNLCFFAGKASVSICL
jgi:hypothetical protein